VTPYVPEHGEPQATGFFTVWDDPNLIGWFLDNELRWGWDWLSPKTLLQDYLAMNPGLVLTRRIDFKLCTWKQGGSL
jgi:hypothetical protein